MHAGINTGTQYANETFRRVRRTLLLRVHYICARVRIYLLTWWSVGYLSHPIIYTYVITRTRWNVTYPRKGTFCTDTCIVHEI